MRTAAMHPATRRAATWRLASTLAGVSLTHAACASSLPPPTSGPVPEQTRAAVHLLNRATYGARPQDVQDVLRIGREQWLERQMKPAPPPPLAQAPPPPPPRAAEMQATMQRGVQGVQRVAIVVAAPAIGTLVQAKLDRAVHSERQLEEVMTDFWFNHFNVFYNKGQVRTTIEDYERNAIRRHVFGKFEDMLRATAEHPAMLVYLDNFQSTAAPPAQTQRPNVRPRGGLNENYARELLELHTLGADNGYTQQDVIEVARAFTGWGILQRQAAPAQQPAGSAPVRAQMQVLFQFQPERHDGGEKIVLGQKLPAGRGMEDGLDVIRMIAQHPATAEHIATKLVRHFVADDPPRELIDELAGVFRKTGGDLRALTRALFTSRTFYEPQYYRAKAKRPFEFVASALRVSGGRVQTNQGIVQQLRTFGHLPYNEAAPTGYPTRAEEWLSAGAMVGRMRFALDLVAGRIGGVALDPRAAFGDMQQWTELLQNMRPAAEPAAASTDAVNAFTSTLLRRTLPAQSTAQLEATIAADVAQQRLTDERGVAARALALVLGSPEFQRY